jgi:hypothetical protein
MTPNRCWEIPQIIARSLYGSLFMDAFVVKSRFDFKSLFDLKCPLLGVSFRHLPNCHFAHRGVLHPPAGTQHSAFALRARCYSSLIRCRGRFARRSPIGWPKPSTPKHQGRCRVRAHLPAASLVAGGGTLRRGRFARAGLRGSSEKELRPKRRPLFSTPGHIPQSLAMTSSSSIPSAFHGLNGT